MFALLLLLVRLGRQRLHVVLAVRLFILGHAKPEETLDALRQEPPADQGYEEGRVAFRRVSPACLSVFFKKACVSRQFPFAL